ncbi:leucine-rich repeat domain-containing protein [Eubacterium xylanophilum]|uniref:leucine-rich repeat domain-containing protein n=1 Tax=Eubacterium xylanophilum TaxID=39497 RepID=UPI0004ADAD8B|nr:hypothetical protein [Eubacterium xylanophilum]
MMKSKKLIAFGMAVVMLGVLTPNVVAEAKKNYKPVITLKGKLSKKAVSLRVREGLSLKYKAKDKEDGNITKKVKIKVYKPRNGKFKKTKKKIVFLKAGKYKVRFSVKDSKKRKTTRNVVVNVKALNSPRPSAEGKNIDAQSIISEPVASEKPVVTKASDVNTNNQVVLDETDVSALKKIIESENEKGLNLPSNILDEKAYDWDNGKLIGINWMITDDDMPGAINISLEGLNNLKKLNLTGVDSPYISLNTRNNTELQELRLINFNLSQESIDIRNNKKLKVLDLESNKSVYGVGKEKFDASQNTELERVCIGACGEYDELDVQNCKKLKYLDCYSFKKVKFGKHDELEELKLHGVDDFDISNCTNLKTLEFMHCPNIDLSKNINLEKIDCHSGDVTELDVSGCENLKSLDCSYNKISKLDISKNIKLENLKCDNNKLDRLDISNNVNLGYLNCSDNSLTYLYASQCKKIYTLMCSNNNIGQLDIAGLEEIVILLCNNNNIRYLNVSSTVWGDLDCSNNQLRELELTGGVGGCSLSCHHNYLKYVDLRSVYYECGSDERMRNLYLQKDENENIVEVPVYF